MTEAKTARVETERTAQKRIKKWSPPSALPLVYAMAGYIIRWVRIAMYNEPDPRNFSQKIQEGFEIVKEDEQPHLRHLRTTRPEYKGGLEIGNLLLMKQPEELARQKQEYYQEQATNQITSVASQYMRENDPRAPMFNEHKTTVSFGKGK